MCINEIVDEILNRCHGTLLSGIKSAPSDIDIYVPAVYRDLYVQFLDENSFVLTCSNQFHSVYRKYENGLLYILDLVSNFNIYTAFQPFYKFTVAGSAAIGRSPDLHRAVKRFSYNKDISVGDQNLRICLERFFCDPINYKTYDVAGRMKNKDDTRSDSYLSLRGGMLWHFLVFLLKIKAYVSFIGTGKTIAFLGPDGAGKSFYIDKLMAAGRTKKQYMGDWFFTFQFFYNYLLKIPSPFNRIVYFFYFFENLGRFLYVSFLKYIGYIVLIDRYPGTGRNVLQTGGLKKINDFIFWVFRNPTLFVLLLAPAEEIYSRKQELSIEEISFIMYALKEQVSLSNHIIVETTDSDVALNSIMKCIFQVNNWK